MIKDKILYRGFEENKLFVVDNGVEDVLNKNTNNWNPIIKNKKTSLKRSCCFHNNNSLMLFCFQKVNGV